MRKNDLEVLRHRNDLDALSFRVPTDKTLSRKNKNPAGVDTSKLFHSGALNVEIERGDGEY